MANRTNLYGSTPVVLRAHFDRLSRVDNYRMATLSAQYWEDGRMHQLATEFHLDEPLISFCPCRDSISSCRNVRGTHHEMLEHILYTHLIGNLSRFITDDGLLEVKITYQRVPPHDWILCVHAGIDYAGASIIHHSV